MCYNLNNSVFLKTRKNKGDIKMYFAHITTKNLLKKETAILQAK